MVLVIVYIHYNIISLEKTRTIINIIFKISLYVYFNCRQQNISQTQEQNPNFCTTPHTTKKKLKNMKLKQRITYCKLNSKKQKMS